jgi:hypothetical protein
MSLPPQIGHSASVSGGRCLYDSLYIPRLRRSEIVEGSWRFPDADMLAGWAGIYPCVHAMLRQPWRKLTSTSNGGRGYFYGHGAWQFDDRFSAGVAEVAWHGAQARIGTTEKYL